VSIIFCPISVFTVNVESSEINHENHELPSYFNWKDYNGKDWTTPAKNQYQYSYCSACCLFAAIGVFESVIKIREEYADFNPNLSEQYVLSCLPNGGNCRNGTWDICVYNSIMGTGSNGNGCNGVVLESFFPYVGRDAEGYSNRFINVNPKPVPCSCILENWEEHLVPMKDWGILMVNDTAAERSSIKQIIVDKGPVVADFSYPLFLVNWNNTFGFLFPSVSFLVLTWGRIHHNPDDYFPCYKNRFPSFGHAIVVVGWKDDKSIPNGGYWICKNSWGTNWGYGGFFNLEYGGLGIDKYIDYENTNYVSWVDYDPESFEWEFEQS